MIESGWRGGRHGIESGGRSRGRSGSIGLAVAGSIVLTKASFGPALEIFEERHQGHDR